MDLDRARKTLLLLPHVAETLQWGEKVVFWAGDKALGGKMFAIADLDPASRFVIAFAAGPQRARELCEIEGCFPAPYLARAHWVAAEHWGILKENEWHHEWEAAHGYVLGRLPLRTQKLLSLPQAQQNRYRKNAGSQERGAIAAGRVTRPDSV